MLEGSPEKSVTKNSPTKYRLGFVFWGFCVGQLECQENVKLVPHNEAHNEGMRTAMIPTTFKLSIYQLKTV